ncbi:MAG: NAD-dependent deacetylase [Acidobacteria bacterium]|jgi:NAD-dependent SIR2 family protein deacetylase|nr:NAD-dependent deacetylase [Acidobacteriota bacterium]
MKNIEELIKQAAERIRRADALVICAGAGMGVDSGLPDFRGDEGFWKAYPPFAKLGHSFIDMANPQWFERDPHLAWGFYGHRLNLYRETLPHKGFDILLRWGMEKTGSYFVFTSNVDGQFQKAGFAQERIVECHGSIHHIQCSLPCCDTTWTAEKTVVVVDEQTMRAHDPLPKCPVCDRVARPNILMFGDWNWIPGNTQAQQQTFYHWLVQNQGKNIVIIECGAGTGVPTVRVNSESIVSKYKAHLIRINARESFVPPGHIGLPLGALEALEDIKRMRENII